MSSTSPMGVKAELDPVARTLTTSATVWTAAAKHTRAGSTRNPAVGDVDVVLSQRSIGRRDVRYLAFRRGEDGWTQLSGAWTTFEAAVTSAARTNRRQAFTATYLTALLELAAGLPDFPRMPEASPDPDAAYKAALENSNDDENGDVQ